jgi:hypothetical protein
LSLAGSEATHVLTRLALTTELLHTVHLQTVYQQFTLFFKSAEVTAEFRLLLHLLLAVAEELLVVEGGGRLHTIGNDVLVVVFFDDVF